MNNDIETNNFNEDFNDNLVEGQKEEDRQKIFELAIIYKKFSDYLQNININNIEEKKGNNRVYMISKEYIDDFKEKIKYEEIKGFLCDDENKDKNYKKFRELTKDYTYQELYSLLCVEIKIYGDFSEIQKDISKGFDFVNYEFLDKLEFEEDLDDYIAYYYRNNNDIMIVFDDKSKLIINQNNGKTKYHVIESPIDKKDGECIKRNKTVTTHVLNKRCKSFRTEEAFGKKKSQTIVFEGYS
jgi:hypothetical protein